MQSVETRRTRSSGMFGGVFWMGVTSALVLGIAGCANYMTEQRSAETQPAADLGPRRPAASLACAS